MKEAEKKPTPLEYILEQINCEEMDFLICALAVLSKDMAEYLRLRGLVDDVNHAFIRAYLPMLNKNLLFWERFVPDLLKNISETELPHGFTQRAAQEDFDLEDLFSTEEGRKAGRGMFSRKGKEGRKRHQEGEDCQKIHCRFPWLRFPGWELQKNFIEILKKDICLGENPFKKYKKGTIQSEEQIIEVAKIILHRGFYDDPQWYPLATVIAVLFIRTGGEKHCNGNNQPVQNVIAASGNRTNL